MKRIQALLMITFFLLIVSLPIFVSSGTVSAQSTGYTITNVTQEVEITYSGQVVLRDSVVVSGQISGSFTLGIPSNFSAYVLKGVAYDSNTIYPLNLGVQLGNRSGYYGAEVNFNGNSPSAFTIALVMSSSLLEFIATTNFYFLSYPSYPSFTQPVANCTVIINLPSTPPSITITKADGTVNTNTYSVLNLPAYSYDCATASFQLATGTLQFTDISQMNRQITISPTGKVTASDQYYLTNNESSLPSYSLVSTAMSFFVVDVPPTATNVVVSDSSGRTLTTTEAGTISFGNDTSPDVLLENTTLANMLATGQSTIITATYNLPGATVSGSTYSLINFTLTPKVYYYVDMATITFSPPEGATIITPQLSALDSMSSLTRNSFQDTYTVTRVGISYIDYGVPEGNTIQLSYTYNPIWVSFLPTVWVSALAVVGCLGFTLFRRRKPEEKATKTTKLEKHAAGAAVLTEVTSQGRKPVLEAASGQRITSEGIKEFVDSYDEKKQLNAELKSLDARAQKGKMPRRQYKVQRAAIETRLETLSRNTNKLKSMFQNSSTAYADLMRQLDSAEEDLADAEQNIKNLEINHSKGAVSIETYKKNIADNQKRTEKAESTISGILLRLREKTR